MTITEFDYIEKNLCEIRRKINNAKLKRDNKYSGGVTAEHREVRLMAVTKTAPVEKIKFAVSRGINLIGENRVNELLEKYEELEKLKNGGLEIHFIGNLQTNKVKYIIDKVDMIQSVNSIRLAEEINKRANLNNKIMDILIEINIGCEESKIGISESDCRGFIEELRGLPNIRVRGLMTIPPFEASMDGTEIKKYFNRMRGLYNALNGAGITTGDDKDYKQIDDKNDKMDILSMGMSEDFEEAVECGSDIIRIGRGIFGERK